MYTLLYEGNVELHETLDKALESTKHLAVAWTIMDPDNKIVFDWMDKVGP